MHTSPQQSSGDRASRSTLAVWRRTIVAILSITVVMALVAAPTSADETPPDDTDLESTADTDDVASSEPAPSDDPPTEEPEPAAEDVTSPAEDKPTVEDEPAPEDAPPAEESSTHDEPPVDESQAEEPSADESEPATDTFTANVQQDLTKRAQVEALATGVHAALSATRGVDFSSGAATEPPAPAVAVRPASLLSSIIPCPPLVPCPPDPLDPIAVDDSYTAEQGLPLSVPDPGVLGNDLSLTGKTLRVDSVSKPAHGTVTMTPFGGFVYFPDAGFLGTDSFTYRNFVDYGFPVGVHRSARATVTVEVTPRPPVAVDDSYTTPFNTAVGVDAPGVLDNDFDNSEGGLTAQLVTRPKHGVVFFTRAGSFAYGPDENFLGTDTFTYRAVDANGLSDEATVNIHVQAPEVVANDDTYTTTAGTPLTVSAPGVLDNDDSDDPLSAQIESDPEHGTMYFLPDGSFTYTPDAGFVGTDSFVYRAVHMATGVPTHLATVTIEVTNTAPVATDDSYTTAHDTQLVVPEPGLLANDSDPDGDQTSATLLSAPENGTLQFTVDGSFVYTPEAGFVGTDSFTYQAIDRHFAHSEPATVTIDVTNSTPVAADDVFSGPTGEALAIGAPGVLGNDADDDVDDLTAELVAGPASGEVALAPDGSFTYTPTDGFSGSDSFTYRAVDTAGAVGLATVSINVEIRATSLVLEVAPNPATKGQAVELVATVVPVEPTELDPTGVVEFFAGERSLGTDTLSSPATLAVSDLGPGTYEITARYEGDPVFAPSTSDPVTLTVERDSTPPVLGERRPDVLGVSKTAAPGPAPRSALAPVRAADSAPAAPASDQQSVATSDSATLPRTGGGLLLAMVGLGLIVLGMIFTQSHRRLHPLTPGRRRGR